MAIITLTYSVHNPEPVHCSMSDSHCCFLTCRQVSQNVGKVVWYSYLFKNCPQFIVIHTVKGFNTVNEAEVFLEFSCFFHDPMDVGNLISGPLPFLNPAWTSGSSRFTYFGRLSWKILSITCWHVKWVQLCGSLNIFWHCPYLGLERKWPFPILWPLLSFLNLLTYWMQHFNSIIL